MKNPALFLSAPRRPHAPRALTVLPGGALAIDVESVSLAFQPNRRPLLVTASYVAVRGGQRLARRASFEFDPASTVVVPRSVTVDGRRVMDPAQEAALAEELLALMRQEI